ncbi:deoxynucleotidyltransferase terminal-interacting protein 2-like isoform X2 [Patiria miniata]|uniref:Fcf2 pre-rRNA processing C-terminal domain-containing protein n=1 Tax=Patiria miniata TaxID=46514 RepID=A0A914AJP3_PATMI|nr:deoxynucleotidyltransferase terminal-interacting protein 2-like isoform X1 [Patiria miniata]XP_038063838.1 deoxynucleotidyltransferase terminal-interacting protein 2-like isoform X2 [Patiria miniata]
MAPTTRISKTKKTPSSQRENQQIPSADEPTEDEPTSADDFSDVSSDGSLSTDSEMEDLVQRTVANMTGSAREEITREGKPKGSKSDTALDIGAGASRGGNKDHTVLPFVVDANPNSKSSIRIEVDHATGSMSNEVSDNDDAFEGETDVIPAKPQLSTSLEQEEEMFISLEPLSDAPSAKSQAVHEKKLPYRQSERLPGTAKPSLELPTELDAGLDLEETYLNFTGEAPKESKMSAKGVLAKSSQDKLLKKSIITPDFEKQHSVPPYRVATRLLKRRKKKERESSTGQEWYNMAAAEMTDQLRNDIKAVRMRSTLDPKRFYKHNDMTAMPKFVQVGTVVESAADFYHSRIPKKQRKQTIVEELLADAETRRYNKRKYLELQERTKRWGPRSSRNRKGKKKAGK